MTSLQGHVVKILSGYSIVIDLGTKQGVSLRDKFVIYELAEPILDLDGKELERLELVKGEVEITHVQELISVGESFKVEKRTSVPFAAIDFMRSVEYTEKVTRKIAEGAESPPKPGPVKVGDLVRRTYQAG